MIWRKIRPLSCRTPCECVDWNLQSLINWSQYLMSHSLWVRGLKYTNWPTNVTGVLVALLVSAWIEISSMRPIAIKLFRRTPCECVDWNFLGKCLTRFVLGRTPCECVDWNHSKCRRAYARTGRTPCECVDWNKTFKKVAYHRRSRTPCECVDWNSMVAEKKN